MTNPIPEDVFINYLYKDEHFILVKDPKHSTENYHYTIWCLHNISNILKINKNCINYLSQFINNIKKLNLFRNEKKYFTYPPTHNRLHLHIVPDNYVSHRPLDNLYYINDIDCIYENIKKINSVNIQKNNSLSLQLKFKIGLIYLKNVKNIQKIDIIKRKEELDCILVIRKQIKDEFLEDLIVNYKLINYHIYIYNVLQYKNMILFDYYSEV